MAATLPRSGLTSEERFLLEWLSKEDFSSHGECRGSALSALVNYGLAHVGKDAGDRGEDYAPVSLTEAGRALLKNA